jgi:phospholipid transport system substrate-binding protein
MTKIKLIMAMLPSMLFGVVFFASTAQSSVDVDYEPLVMLKKISGELFNELDRYRKKGNLKDNRQLVDFLVRRVIVPHFDLTHMSQTVVGSYYWKQASEEVQQHFINEFARYIIRTYSSAMQSYDGEIMKFYPIRDKTKDKININSELLLKNRPPIQLQYKLYLHNNTWLIYDFSIDGVSIIKNYNSQFASILRQRELAGLVQELHRRNVDLGISRES